MKPSAKTAEKLERLKKPITLSFRLGHTQLPVTTWARKFALRSENAAEGVVEILLQCDSGVSHRVVFDGVMLQRSARSITEYLAGLQTAPDDAAQIDSVPMVPEMRYANMAFLSRVSTRVEMVFGWFPIHQMAVFPPESEAKGVHEIIVQPVLVIYSSLPFQVKLASELLRAFNLS